MTTWAAVSRGVAGAVAGRPGVRASAGQYRRGERGGQRAGHERAGQSHAEQQTGDHPAVAARGEQGHPGGEPQEALAALQLPE